jgi:hypothetical protein
MFSWACIVTRESEKTGVLITAQGTGPYTRPAIIRVINSTRNSRIYLTLEVNPDS